MALRLQEMGVPARSWQGWQVPVQATGHHESARIDAIPTDNLNKSFESGHKVAVIAGFQGVMDDGRIATLGEARKLNNISYEEMLELASLGAKVLQTRSVELARSYKIPLRVLSSFEEDISENIGTMVCQEKDIMENIKAVKGVAYSRDEAKLTLVSVADRPGVAAAIFVPLADAGVNVDMIVQNISEEGRTDMTFSCPVDQVIRAKKALTEAMSADLINYKELIADTLVAKISIVGNGMRSHAGVAAQMFEVLANEGVNIRVITTSEIKVSVLVDRKYMELAVRALHDAFELENA